MKPSITAADTTLICQVNAERQRLEDEIQVLEQQAAALSDFQIGHKFGISALQVRDIIRRTRGGGCECH